MKIDISKFNALIEEIDARAPGFWGAYELGIDQSDLEYAMRQDFACPTDDDLASVSAAILNQWSEKGVQLGPSSDDSEPVAQEMLKSVSDAVAGVYDCAFGHGSVEMILAEQYEPIHDANGKLIAYFRIHGNEPLLLLNAFGIPLRIWQKLLGGEHGYKIIVPVLSSCDTVHGGMEDGSSVCELQEQLKVLLGRLAIRELNVLAWCNAGRLGIELIKECGDKISNLILLSPTLRGGETDQSLASPYEDNLAKLFGLVRASPKSALVVSTMLGQVPALPDWSALQNPRERADILFGLPRRELISDLSKPMAKPSSLIQYASRTERDEAASAGQVGALPACLVVLVQGENDSIVNNQQARNWLEKYVENFEVYEVSGAGHYIQDMQYPYLIHMLERVIRGSRGRLPTRIHHRTKETICK